MSTGVSYVAWGLLAICLVGSVTATVALVIKFQRGQMNPVNGLGVAAVGMVLSGGASMIAASLAA